MITRSLMALVTEMHWTSNRVHVKRNSHLSGREILIFSWNLPVHHILKGINETNR